MRKRTFNNTAGGSSSAPRLYNINTSRGQSFNDHAQITDIFNINENDLVLAVMALNLMGNKLGNRYRQAVNNLVSRIRLSQGNNFDDAFADFSESDIGRANPEAAIDEHLIWQIIRSAATRNKTLQIALTSQHSSDKMLIVSSPRMIFSCGWKLRGIVDQAVKTFDLEDICFASIIA